MKENNYFSPISLSIIVTAILISLTGAYYIHESKEKSSLYDNEYYSANSINVTGKAEKEIKLDTLWAVFDVEGVNIQGENATTENNKLYDQKVSEINAKFANIVKNKRDIDLTIADTVDYNPEDKAPAPSPTSTLTGCESAEYDAPCSDEEFADYNYGYEDYYGYDTDPGSEKRVFNVVVGVPNSEVTFDQMSAIVDELGGKKVNIYNSLNQEDYEDLQQELNLKALADGKRKARSIARELGQSITYSSSYTTDVDEYDMKFYIVDSKNSRYVLQKDMSFDIED